MLVFTMQNYDFSLVSECNSREGEGCTHESLKCLLVYFFELLISREGEGYAHKSLKDLMVYFLKLLM